MLQNKLVFTLLILNLNESAKSCTARISAEILCKQKHEMIMLTNDLT